MSVVRSIAPRKVEERVLFRTHQMAVALVMAAALTLVGCAAPAETSTESPERLRVSGSGTALPLIRIMAEAYDSEQTDFVFLPGLHSGGGITGVAGGDLEIGSVSRELTAEEQALDIEYIKLSDDGLVIATHPSVTIEGLTSEQVREIYRGEHQSWSELGGPDLGIVILDRNEDESAKLVMREFVLGPDLEITDHAVSLFYEPDMIDGLVNTQGAIGYFSLGYGLSEEVPVNYLELDGVEPSLENLESGAYEMVRPLGIVVARPTPDPVVSFIEWVRSDEAVELMSQRGYARPRADEGER